VKRRVLLIDDNHWLLASAGQLLREAGYLVTSTNSGADALCLLHSKPSPDVVLLDLMMPGVDGYTVLKHLGPTAPPVVLMTGAVVDDETIDSAKVARVLRKPFDGTALLGMVAECLSGDPMTETKEEPAPVPTERLAAAAERLLPDATSAERAKAVERLARNL
jgi:CheY-like chemotaxis protein